MDSALKQRLIGAAVLVALAMIFLPMLLRGPETAEPDAAQVPLDMPAAPDQEFETRELPLTVPQTATPDEGVLGMDTAPPSPADPNAVATVDQTGLPAPRSDFDPNAEAPADADAAPGTVAATDAATGLPSDDVPPADLPAEPAVAVEPTPAPPPATTAGGRYVVNVGSFSNLANARALADKLRARGLPLTSESVDVSGKPAMRLRVGPYGDRTAAEAARLRVEAVTGGSANVIAVSGSAPAAATPRAPTPAPAATPPASTPAVAAAPRPATPAPVPRASTAPNVGFAVQLGALSSEADANVLRDRARAAGFVAFHQRVNTDRGAVWRVRVGPEADRAAADLLREQVGARLGLRDAIVVSHP